MEMALMTAYFFLTLIILICYFNLEIEGLSEDLPMTRAQMENQSILLEDIEERLSKLEDKIPDKKTVTRTKQVAANKTDKKGGDH